MESPLYTMLNVCMYASVCLLHRFQQKVPRGIKTVYFDDECCEMLQESIQQTKNEKKTRPTNLFAALYSGQRPICTGKRIVLVERITVRALAGWTDGFGLANTTNTIHNAQQYYLSFSLNLQIYIARSVQTHMLVRIEIGSFAVA